MTERAKTVFFTKHHHNIKFGLENAKQQQELLLSLIFANYFSLQSKVALK